MRNKAGIIWRKLAVGFGATAVVVGVLAAPASAKLNPNFQGNCNDQTMTCVLDEPAGNNPATHGTVTWTDDGNVLAFTINADAPITEVQICMQESGPFAQGPNVCAGNKGPHVTYSKVGNVYSVDLAANGLSEPVFFTLHVIAGGRTLQVNGSSDGGGGPA